MIWFPPRTWAAADYVTPARFNTYIRDNQKALVAGCRVYSTVTGSVPASTSGPLNWTGVAGADPLGMWTGASGLYARLAGTYRVSARWGGSSPAFETTIAIRKNGQEVLLPGIPGNANLLLGEYPVTLVAGDYLELVYAIGASGYTLSTSSLPVGGVSADMQMRWVAP